MSYLVSPTERDVLALLGDSGLSSSLPEKYGSDFLIFSPRGRCGIQRKKFPEDFFASLADGRIVREVGLMASLEFRWWIIEGEPIFTSDGQLLYENYTRWTRQQLRNLLRRFFTQEGAMVEWSNNVQDTVEIVREIEVHLRKIGRSLNTRPKDSGIRDEWGNLNKRAWARYFLQGFPGIGADKALAIFDTFGRVPMRWDCTEEELLDVYGIGKKTVQTLYMMFEPNLRS